jgi:hypothetical protein
MGFLAYLIERAFARRFVRTPAQKPGAVPKTILGEMIVLNLNHKSGIQRLPLRAAGG